MSKPVRVLLVEDEEAHAELIAMAFSRSGENTELTHAVSLVDAEAKLSEHQPDIIISDWVLPDGKGLDLLETVPQAKQCPFVVMTSHGSEQVAVDALKAGALDYIVKSPMTFEQLPHVAQRAVREWTNIKERKRAEEKYRSIVEGAPVGILSVSVEGKILAANPALAKMYGYDTLDEGLEQLENVAQHYKNPEDRILFLSEVIEKGSVKDYEMEHVRLDGSTIWVSYTAAVAYDESHEIASVEGFLIDVTERKLSDERLKDYQNQLERDVLARTRELEESRQRLLDIIEFFPDAIFVVNSEGEVVAWNQAMAELTGVPKERIIGKANYEHAIHLYGVRKPVLIDLILSGQAQHVEGPMKGGDATFSVETSLERLRGGKGAYVAIKASPLLDRDGNIIGAIESVRDITQRKEAELALKQQLQFIQSLVDVIPSAIYYSDQSGKITLCNTSFEVFMGMSREDLVGVYVEDVLEPEYLERRNQYEALLFSGEESVVYEGDRKDAKGDFESFMVHKAAHRDSDGQILGVVTVATDISERKQMENELRVAKDHAEAANSAKSRFLATMSHEIRTPLNAIMGLTDITLHQQLTEEQTGNLEAIMDTARHLLVVLNDILDYSKIEADKLQLEEMVFTLDDVLDPLRHTFAPQADQKNVALALSVEGDISGALVGDPFRLRQVLINLIGNALKFTESGTIRLSANQKAVNDDEVEVEFRVTDSGIGIAPEKLKLIFDSFSQAEGDITRRYGGTGLGLTISSRLVEMMGGQLQVSSNTGQGSEFTFTVRFGACEELPQAVTTDHLDVGSGLAILVAEDNALNAKVAKEFFARMGHVATTVGDGHLVVQALQEHSYDMIFMDLEMPSMDGLEAASRIRSGEAGEGNKHIPIVAMTAHALSEVRESCLDAGMDYFATKPIEYAKLREAVAAVLKPGMSEPSAPKKPEHLCVDWPRSAAESEVVSPEEVLQQLENFPLLDWQDFLDDLGGNRELLLGFYEDFKESLPASEAGLLAALEAGDKETAVRVAHSLKGSAGTARAGRVSEMAKQLESIGTSHGIAGMLPLVEMLRTQVAAVMEALNRGDFSTD